MKSEFAVLGGGCFWCTEAIYKRVKGVKTVVSGYAGGHTKNPSYQSVCNGNTGHAEVIQIEYDPGIISYKEIIDIFWHAHDPTTLNRQGNDRGPQYRSIILFSGDEQKNIAEKSMQDADESGDFRIPIVTEIAPLEDFYPAEAYHQDFFENNPNQPYCRAIISPKVRHFIKDNPEKLKESS